MLISSSASLLTTTKTNCLQKSWKSDHRKKEYECLKDMCACMSAYMPTEPVSVYLVTLFQQGKEGMMLLHLLWGSDMENY